MKSDLTDTLRPVILHLGLANQHGDWNFKNVCSPFSRIYYVLGGEAQIEYPDRKIRLHPGFLYIIPAFVPHGYACGGDFRHFYIHVYDENAENVLEDWELPLEVPSQPGDRELIERLHYLCPGMEVPASDPRSYDNPPTLKQNLLRTRRQELFARMESRGIILCLLSRFFRTAKPKWGTRDSRIEKALSYVRSHPSLFPGTDDLSRLTCLSKSHFIRLFRQEMGCTPLQYIISKKMERAQSRLVTDHIEIKEIAFQLGFSDPSYFNRLFKKSTGITPREYRAFHSFPHE